MMNNSSLDREEKGISEKRESNVISTEAQKRKAYLR